MKPTRIEQVEVHALETGEPIRYTGPLDHRVGTLQIIGPHERTLCGLPLQPYWRLQSRGERQVCRGCLAKLLE